MIGINDGEKNKFHLSTDSLSLMSIALLLFVQMSGSLGRFDANANPLCQDGYVVQPRPEGLYPPIGKPSLAPSGLEVDQDGYVVQPRPEGLYPPIGKPSLAPSGLEVDQVIQ